MVGHDNAQSVEKVKNIEFELENACCDVELMKKVFKKMNVDWKNREGMLGVCGYDWDCTGVVTSVDRF